MLKIGKKLILITTAEVKCIRYIVCDIVLYIILHHWRTPVSVKEITSLEKVLIFLDDTIDRGNPFHIV